MPSLIVIGSGPGIALSTAALFAEKKFNKVALLSRSITRLPKDKAAILDILKSKGKTDVEIDTWDVDVSDWGALKNVLHLVEQRHADVTCVLFNAARVAPSPLLEFTEEEIVKDFMVGSHLLVALLDSPPHDKYKSAN
jgi:NAD(P)-dependent dehydrogenase (short-subunit alcohol dehydrogenase family)